MIVSVSEGDTTWLPGFSPSLLPHRLPDGIKLHVRGDVFGIEVQGLAGTVPLLNGDTLRILPKIDRVNFLRLLFRAEGAQRDLERDYDGFVEYAVEDSSSFDVIVARQLMLRIAEILFRSVQQGRIEVRRRGRFAAGKIDPIGTAYGLSVRDADPVRYSVRQRTVDIAENRILTEAAIRSWHYLPSSDRARFHAVFNKWCSRIPRSTDLPGDLLAIQRGFASRRFGGPRDYYRRALMLALIVLGSDGVGFEGSRNVEGDALLINTADIFEKYLRNVISAANSEKGYVVTKGGLGTRSLYTNGAFDLEPDIVVSRDASVLLILDAKYKKPSADDHYQMLAYLSAFGIARGVFLAPSFSSNEVEVVEYTTPDRYVVREVYLPMSDLAATEEFLAEVVQKFA